MKKMTIKNLTRNEMKKINGGNGSCYPITCCQPSSSPKCVPGPCVGPGICTDFCYCDDIIH